MITAKNTSKANTPTVCQGLLVKLLDEYRLSLQALNRSSKTISWYMQILGRYLNFLAERSLLKPLADLGAPELRAYILYLQQCERWAGVPNIRKSTGKLSAYSIQGHVRCIKAFWSFLEREGYLASNPLAKFLLPKVPKKPMSTLSREQVDQLLASVNRHNPIGAKYFLIILLLYDTGIRISELVSIKTQDIDLKHDRISVLGKGQKVRPVFFCSDTKKEIKRYINDFRSQCCQNSSPYLFPRKDGCPVSVNSVQQFLRRLANRAGLTGVKCSPHVFRHSFATESAAWGADSIALMEIMGHESVVTTQKYTHLRPHELRRLHTKFSPVKKLRRKWR